MLSRDNTLLKIAEAYKKQQSKTMEFVDEVFGQVYTIAVEDANEFITKAAAAKKAGESTFKLGGKEYPVTIKIDPDKVLEAERVLKKGKGDMPDVIINPTDDDLRESESVVSEAENDDKYVVIDFHEKGGGFVMTKPGSKKDAEDSARSIRKGSDISKREVLKVSDARKIRGLAGEKYLNDTSFKESVVNEGFSTSEVKMVRSLVKRYAKQYTRGNYDDALSFIEGILEDLRRERDKIMLGKDYREEAVVKESARSLSDIASEIRRDWKKVNYAAEPYLDAMSTLNSIKDNYFMDSGDMIVRYFLANATTWRGDTAKRIKAELKAMLK